MTPPIRSDECSDCYEQTILSADKETGLNNRCVGGVMTPPYIIKSSAVLDPHRQDHVGKVVLFLHGSQHDGA